MPQQVNTCESSMDARWVADVIIRRRKTLIIGNSVLPLVEREMEHLVGAATDSSNEGCAGGGRPSPESTLGPDDENLSLKLDWAANSLQCLFSGSHQF